MVTPIFLALLACVLPVCFADQAPQVPDSSLYIVFKLPYYCVDHTAGCTRTILHQFDHHAGAVLAITFPAYNHEVSVFV